MTNGVMTNEWRKTVVVRIEPNSVNIFGVLEISVNILEINCNSRYQGIKIQFYTF